MTAQEILKMIEEVDPADTAKLDEIDYLAECFIRKNDSPIWLGTQYTRSRDALKSVRPMAFTYTIVFEQYKGHSAAMTWVHDPDVQFVSPIGLQEELAELHAIISAIQWERTKI